MISFKGMGRFSLIAAVLTILLYLSSGCSGVPLIPGKPVPGVQNQQPMKTWPPTPEPTTETPVPSWTPEPPVSYDTPTETQDPDATSVADFEHFTVRITGTTGDTEHFNIQAEVCVTKAVNSNGTRISTGPWTVTTTAGDVYHPLKSQEAGLAGLFPRSALYNKGECAYGWIAFNTHGADIREIGYANSLGDQALWGDDGLRI